MVSCKSYVSISYTLINCFLYFWDDLTLLNLSKSYLKKKFYKLLKLLKIKCLVYQNNDSFFKIYLFCLLYFFKS